MLEGLRAPSALGCLLLVGLIFAGCGSAATPATAPPVLPTLAASSTAPSAPATAGPTQAATPSPTLQPTATPAPTPEPTAQPTTEPTPEPTPEPTEEPTPTLAPGATPRGTPIDIVSYLTAQIDLLHLGESALNVSIDLADSGQSATVATFELSDLDVVNESVPAGTYTVTFTRPSDPTNASTCTLEIKDGDHVEFVSTDETIMVVDPANPVTTRSELVIETSTRCAKAATS